MVALTLDRMVAIARPFKHKTIFTKRFCIGVCIAVWLPQVSFYSWFTIMMATNKNEVSVRNFEIHIIFCDKSWFLHPETNQWNIIQRNFNLADSSLISPNFTHRHHMIRPPISRNQNFPLEPPFEIFYIFRFQTEYYANYHRCQSSYKIPWLRAARFASLVWIPFFAVILMYCVIIFK